MATTVETRATRLFMKIATYLVLAFLYFPLLVIFLYAFNPSRGQAWPLPGLTTKWFGVAWRNQEIRRALVASVKAGSGATAVALLLGTLAALAVHRFRFFGRETVSFLLVLPIALPGIVTGLALNSAIQAGHINFSLWTII